MSFNNQVNGLIDLVLQGEDPTEIAANVMEEIYEGYGNGPYPIGSSVKLNQSWSGEDIEGKSLSLSKGSVVSVIHTNMGDTGHDKMVLYNGKTKAVVPLKILGEQSEPSTENKEPSKKVKHLEDNEPKNSPTTTIKGNSVPSSMEGKKL
jgi:hypothetical protein